MQTFDYVALKTESVCPYCRGDLLPNNRFVIAHQGDNGAKHPLHLECALEALQKSSRCFVCKEQIDPHSITQLENTVYRRCSWKQIGQAVKLHLIKVYKEADSHQKWGSLALPVIPSFCGSIIYLDEISLGIEPPTEQLVHLVAAATAVIGFVVILSYLGIFGQNLLTKKLSFTIVDDQLTLRKKNKKNEYCYFSL